jgi:hypothetical protein
MPVPPPIIAICLYLNLGQLSVLFTISLSEVGLRDFIPDYMFTLLLNSHQINSELFQMGTKFQCDHLI